MDEYIEREAAIRALTLHDCDSAGAKMAICDLPAADVAPVRHGRWIEKWGLYDKGFYISRKVWYECSHCGMKTNYRDECFEKEVDYNYCPNCGADMRGSNDE